MSIENQKEPALPFFCQGTTTGPEIYYGLTKRELFAAMAMQALRSDTNYGGNPRECAQDAVAYADALLAELGKGDKP